MSFSVDGFPRNNDQPTIMLIATSKKWIIHFAGSSPRFYVSILRSRLGQGMKEETVELIQAMLLIYFSMPARSTRGMVNFGDSPKN